MISTVVTRMTALNNITGGHDLAVLELEEEVTFTADKWPLCLPQPGDWHLIEQGRGVMVSGFGVHRITDENRFCTLPLMFT